jgi:hypothetical protein
MRSPPPHTPPMSSPPRSLKHEYELYVEREIENYKESVPRSALLSIGDEAVRGLAREQQLALTEMLLCEEVDRIIFRRLRLPTYRTWLQRRRRALEKFKTPEHWGLGPEEALVRSIATAADTKVVVAGPSADDATLYLAAHGCDVTTLDTAIDTVDRVMAAAEAAGLTARVHGHVAALGSWAPAEPVHAVVTSPEAFDGLSALERAQVIATLQGATCDGGVHLVRTLVAGQQALSIDELRVRYVGWQVSVEPSTGAGRTFVARKRA